MIRDLGDGLILRAGTAADAGPLATFVADILRAQDSDEPNRLLHGWCRDLMQGRHPTFEPGDVTIVAEARGGAIVSCLHLISQTWAYGGVPIAVGQPELIGTDTRRRGRRLVRTQFDVIHRWSAERRQLMLTISGIPWFYRQFGYELAIERGGGPKVHVDSPLPPAPAGWRVRAADDADVPFLTRLGAIADARALVSVPRDETLWRYELHGHSADSAARCEIRILERDGEPVGYVIHAIALFGGTLGVVAFEVAPGVSWREAWVTALPYLVEAGEGVAKVAPDARFTDVGFWFLGRSHPLFDVDRFMEWEDGYAWYARVPDVPAFLRTVAPALERRLATSPCAGHTGSLTLSFYRDGVRLTLDRGRITTVEAWPPDLTIPSLEFGRPSPDPRRPLAMFPDLTFLQLLFGFRSLSELEAAFPDCVIRTNEARALLNALFPKTPSAPWPVV